MEAGQAGSTPWHAARWWHWRPPANLQPRARLLQVPRSRDGQASGGRAPAHRLGDDAGDGREHRGAHRLACQARLSARCRVVASSSCPIRFSASTPFPASVPCGSSPPFLPALSSLFLRTQGVRRSTTYFMPRVASLVPSFDATPGMTSDVVGNALRHPRYLAPAYTLGASMRLWPCRTWSPGSTAPFPTSTC